MTFARHLRLWPGLLVLIALTGCSSLKGNLSDGVYSTPSQAYSVAVPDFHDQETTDGVTDTVEWVTFRSGCCYWSPFGEYQVQWLPDAAGTGDFSKAAEDLLHREIGRADKAWVLPANRETGKFKLLAEETLEINGRLAARRVGEMTIDRAQAVACFTVVDFGKNLAVGTLRCSVQEDNTPQEYATFREWGLYLGLLDSLQENPAK